MVVGVGFAPTQDLFPGYCTGTSPLCQRITTAVFANRRALSIVLSEGLYTRLSLKTGGQVYGLEHRALYALSSHTTAVVEPNPTLG